MKKLASVIVFVMSLILLAGGCVRKEKEEKAKEPLKPSPLEKPAVVPPEVQQKVEALLVPAHGAN